MSAMKGKIEDKHHGPEFSIRKVSLRCLFSNACKTEKLGCLNLVLILETLYIDNIIDI